MSLQENKVRQTYHWIIPNFTRDYAEGCKSGYKIESETMVLMLNGAKTVWFMRLNPNGDSFKQMGNLSVFLCLKSAETSEEIKLNFCFDLIKMSGENYFKCDTDQDVFKKDVNESWGHPTFISHAGLFAHKDVLLPNDKLTLSCRLDLLSEINDSVSLPSVSENPVDDVVEDLQNMFNKEIETDFELRFKDGQTLKAHKTILIARSPVFLKMLTTDMKESKENFVAIPDFDSKTMKELLRFVYCCEIENLDDIATDLIFAAEKYQIAKLKKICSDHIVSKLSIDKEKVLDALIIADRISGLDNLIKKCVGIVITNYKEFSMSPKWNQLSKEMAFKILGETMNHYRCNINYV